LKTLSTHQLLAQDKAAKLGPSLSLLADSCIASLSHIVDCWLLTALLTALLFLPALLTTATALLTSDCFAEVNSHPSLVRT